MQKPRAKKTKLGRYQQKRRLGLVPFHYDRESRSFREGAWKNWTHDPGMLAFLRHRAGLASA